MEVSSITVPEPSPPGFGFVPAFALHTAIVYTCALQFSMFLVGRWFAWVAPLLQIPRSAPPGDWYLQHFELAIIVPALVAGYIDVWRFIPALVGKPVWETRLDSAVSWAWCIPTLVLCLRMLLYHAPSSVLFASSMTALQYFFEIQKFMPTWMNRGSGDSVRVAAQMLVTGPFYAGVAYSAGALLSKHRLLVKLFTFEKHEE